MADIKSELIRWLELRQNQSLYSDKSPAATIEDLIMDVTKCVDTPWENIPEPSFRGPQFDERS